MADEADLVRTVTGPVRVELPRIEGSRFVADLAPAGDEATALAVVEQVRSEFPDASHHCWAFVLADGRARSSDDGEPRDTAGAPIQRHLQGADLRDVVAVVTRWFGGTKLGRGGLVRAYGDAAALAIAEAPIVERPVLITVRFTHPYDLTAAVEAVLAAHDVEEVAADYGAEVTRTLTVPQHDAETFADALREATAGQVETNTVT